MRNSLEAERGSDCAVRRCEQKEALFRGIFRGVASWDAGCERVFSDGDITFSSSAEDEGAAAALHDSRSIFDQKAAK